MEQFIKAKNVMKNTIDAIDLQLEMWYAPYSFSKSRIPVEPYHHYSINYGTYTLSIALIRHVTHKNTVEVALLNTDDNTWVFEYSLDSDINDYGIIPYLPFKNFKNLCFKLFDNFKNKDDEGLLNTYIAAYHKYTDGHYE